MPKDLKYGEVTLERQRNIQDDEPVFVFRAQDAMLPAILGVYYELCLLNGSPAHHLQGIERAREAVEEWQRFNEAQVPTSPSFQGATQ